MEDRELMRESNRFLTEKFAEIAQLQKENERFLTEKFAESDRLRQESERLRQENERKFDEQMKKMREEIGYIGESQGSFAEEYFFDSFEKGEKNFFGKKFDAIGRNLNLACESVNGECDIVLYNKDAVAIIEVKFKARKKHIKELLKKVEIFKMQFPCYKDFNIYLGLASMIFPSNVKQGCLEKGIAVIKQVGDKVVIIDEGLKAF